MAFETVARGESAQQEGHPYVAVPLEVFGDLVLTLRQCARRLESHARNPGVVDAAVLATSRRAIIAGAAIMRMAKEDELPVMSLVDTDAEWATSEAIDREVTSYDALVQTMRALADGEAHGAVDLGRLSPRVHDELLRVAS